MNSVSTVVKAYRATPRTLVVVIPKEVRVKLGIKVGDRFLVKFDVPTKRIIYELLGGEHASNRVDK